MKTLGLYLHIPFCRQKCAYCDFCSFPHPKAETMEHYTEVLCTDLQSASKNCTDYTVDTVFFGGGTPTLLPTDLLLRIFNTVVKNYRLSTNAEITLECNPATVSSEALLLLRRGGFNRLSIGLQSIHENELRALGRIHTYADFLSTWNSARKAGFDNLSADLMFGIPEQTEESLQKTLEEVVNLHPEHLSLYSLILEEGTPLEANKEHLVLPSEETVARMYLSAVEYLEKHGIHQYEISNFAQTGRKSRHNYRYWNQEEFLGFGPSAYSDFGGERYGFSRNLKAYLDGNRTKRDIDRPNTTGRMNEYVMLRLRLAEGLSYPDLQNRYGVSAVKTFQARLAPYLATEFLKVTTNGVALTPKGMLVSNQILSEILDF